MTRKREGYFVTVPCFSPGEVAGVGGEVVGVGCDVVGGV